MHLQFSERFHRSYAKTPLAVRRAFRRRAAFLLRDLRHPSLRAKKYDESLDVWQARVNDDWRFYFRIEGDIYRFIDITPHPK